MRYVVRPRLNEEAWEERTPLIEGKTVYEPGAVDTGLLDRGGQKIFRVMSPIGFTELKERG